MDLSNSEEEERALNNNESIQSSAAAVSKSGGTGSQQAEADDGAGDNELFHQMMDVSRSEEDTDDGGDDSDIDIQSSMQLSVSETGETSSVEPCARETHHKRKLPENAEARRVHACKEHNRKERVRRKSMKVTVLELWKQLRSPPKKASYISVLKSAREEIKDLNTIKERDETRLDALKREHSRLKWKLEELVTDIKKIPADSKPFSPTATSHSLPSPSPSSPHFPPNFQPRLPTVPTVPIQGTPTGPLVGMIVPSIVNLGNMPSICPSIPPPPPPLLAPNSFLMYSPQHPHISSHFPPLMRPPGNLMGPPFGPFNPLLPFSSNPHNIPGIVPPGPPETYISSSHFPISLQPQAPQLGGLPGLMAANPFFHQTHPSPNLFFNRLASQEPVFPITVFKDRPPPRQNTYSHPASSSSYNTLPSVRFPPSLSHPLPPPLVTSSSSQKLWLPPQMTTHPPEQASRELIIPTSNERIPYTASSYQDDSDSLKEPLLVVDIEDEDDTPQQLPSVFKDSISAKEKEALEDGSEDVPPLDYDEGERKTKRGFRSSSTDSESEGSCSPGLGGRRRPTGRRNTSTPPTSCVSSTNHRNRGKKIRNKKAGLHCGRTAKRSIPPLLKVTNPEVQILGEENVKIILKNCQVTRNFESELQFLPPCPKLFNHSASASGNGMDSGSVLEGKAKYCWVDDNDDDIIERSVNSFKRKFSDFNSDFSSNIAIPQR